MNPTTHAHSVPRIGAPAAPAPPSVAVARTWRIVCSAMAVVCLVFASTSFVNEAAMFPIDRTIFLDVSGIDTVWIATDDADISLSDAAPTRPKSPTNTRTTSTATMAGTGASTAVVSLHLSGSRSLKSSHLRRQVKGRTLEIELTCDGSGLVGGRCVHQLDVELSTRANVKIISVIGDIDARWSTPPRRIDVESGCGRVDVWVPRRQDGYQVTMTGGIQVPHSTLIDNPESPYRIDARSDCGRVSLNGGG